MIIGLVVWLKINVNVKLINIKIESINCCNHQIIKYWLLFFIFSFPHIHVTVNWICRILTVRLNTTIFYIVLNLAIIYLIDLKT